jgi:hypothetical protein
MRLGCRLGRHTWATRIEQGESYEVCTACGKQQGRADRDPLVGTDDVARRVRADDRLARTLGADRIPDER